MNSSRIGNSTQSHFLVDMSGSLMQAYKNILFSRIVSCHKESPSTIPILVLSVLLSVLFTHNVAIRLQNFLKKAT